jgi:hypothetical protein
MTTRPAPRRAAVLVTAALLLPPAVAVAAPADAAPAVLAAAEGHSRRALAETPRDQFALVLYGLLGLATVAGIGTLRRQLRGEHEQSDGEFRWR